MSERHIQAMSAANYPDTMSEEADVVEDSHPSAGWRRVLRLLPDRGALAILLAVWIVTDFVEGFWSTLAVVAAMLLATTAVERAWQRRRAARA